MDSFKTLIARTKDKLQRDAYHRISNLKEEFSFIPSRTRRFLSTDGEPKGGVKPVKGRFSKKQY